ncbi:recombinase zinc beta ribbon domain-containing protein [Trichocoleus sp. FACHB-262]|uniref:recombinase zinc beta ribbon domain-containing protein n=1 Tax=Trichocoleus sp. FACHB-262 TaxID=2692869 RepID=UPI001688D570|nr:recombinase zinc beta ribbon domain-containing protein [Trichocoleus sp. FACHB-262]MBD2124757.1 recombinase zinc beta ribbon domain-containing protein [Trichocoleus sp. FACHB-262]
MRQHFKEVRTNLVLTEQLLFWSYGGDLRDWLNNPVLQGHTVYHKSKNRRRQDPSAWEIHRDTHPDQRLISDEEVAEIKAILKQNSRNIGQVKGANFALTGLVFCGQCGYKCVLKRTAEHSYYGCRHSGGGCSNRKCVRLEKIDQAIVNALFTRALSTGQEPENSLQEQSQPAGLTTLEKILADLENVPGYASIPSLRATKDELTAKIERTKALAKQELTLDGTAEYIISHPTAKNINFWRTRTKEDREVIYRKLVNRVTILGGEVILPVSLKV